MKYIFPLIALLLSSCATEQRIPAALDAQLDSALTAGGVAPLRKAKFTGPVTFQIGGAHNTATAIAKASGPVAAAPHAAATATTASGPPWWVYLGGGLLLVLGGFLLRGRLKIPRII